jgi:hypothetical protein
MCTGYAKNSGQAKYFIKKHCAQFFVVFTKRVLWGIISQLICLSWGTRKIWRPTISVELAANLIVCFSNIVLEERKVKLFFERE